MSHHHFDHSGGLRVAVAEGLTIVTHRANEAFFKDLVARQHTIVPGRAGEEPAPATFEFVDDQLTLKDKSMEVQLYHLIDNPREGTNLFAMCRATACSCRPTSTMRRGCGTRGARTCCRTSSAAD